MLDELSVERCLLCIPLKTEWAAMRVWMLRTLSVWTWATVVKKENSESQAHLRERGREKNRDGTDKEAGELRQILMAREESTRGTETKSSPPYLRCSRIVSCSRKNMGTPDGDRLLGSAARGCLDTPSRNAQTALVRTPW